MEGLRGRGGTPAIRKGPEAGFASGPFRGAIKHRVIALLDLLKEPDAPLTEQVRRFTALLAMHAGMPALRDVEGDPGEKRKAAPGVAVELVTKAHDPGPAAQGVCQMWTCSDFRYETGLIAEP
ncbi:hypothetical protein ACFWVP_20775 [Streptomyces sp. NPDC058637]|uniref:hypothetical protein n=1 Tax=Streptomyces sp. NPDC058637 TaxID=3346569 RepID=UPI00364962FF